MAPSGLLTSPIRDALVVDFGKISLVDGGSVENVRSDLIALIDQAAPKKVVLDFTKVRFLSSSLLGVLVDFDAKLGEQRGRLVICGLRPHLHKVFKITRLDKRLTFAANETEALRILGIDL